MRRREARLELLNRYGAWRHLWLYIVRQQGPRLGFHQRELGGWPGRMHGFGEPPAASGRGRWLRLRQSRSQSGATGKAGRPRAACAGDHLARRSGAACRTYGPGRPTSIQQRARTAPRRRGAAGAHRGAREEEPGVEQVGHDHNRQRGGDAAGTPRSATCAASRRRLPRGAITAHRRHRLNLHLRGHLGPGSPRRATASPR